MGGVSPETFWASHKYEIKFWYTVASCWIFFVNYTMMHGSTNIKWPFVSPFSCKSGKLLHNKSVRRLYWNLSDDWNALCTHCSLKVCPLSGLKPNAYVCSLNLFTKAATGKTQSNIRVFVWEEQDRQCSYNVTLRCVLANIVAVEKI